MPISVIKSNILSARKTVLSDISFYASILRDETYMRNTGFSMDDFKTEEQLRNYTLENSGSTEKWIVYDNDSQTVIGFCHLKEIDSNQKEIFGGASHEALSSGKCVKSFIFIIDYFFKTNPSKTLISKVYQNNIRSIKMDLALGFELVSLLKIDSRKFDIFTLNRDNFYSSPLVKRILHELFF